MKKKVFKNSAGFSSEERERLKRWKKASAKVKLEWLENALIFGKAKKFEL